MLRGEIDVRAAILKAVSPYKLAGVEVLWGGSHRAGEAVLVLGDSRESVFYPRAAGKEQLAPIMQRVKQALRRIGATHVDLQAIKDEHQRRAERQVSDAAERLFGGGARVRRS